MHTLNPYMLRSCRLYKTLAGGTNTPILRIIVWITFQAASCLVYKIIPRTTTGTSSQVSQWPSTLSTNGSSLATNSDTKTRRTTQAP